MEEITAEGEAPDHDIIQLLNAKKKNREILSITNAAVDALSSRQHGENKNAGFKHSPEEEKENNSTVKRNVSISESLCSTSSKDFSFNGRHRVRIPSRLLREINSPLERSNSGNEKSTSETGDASTGSSSSLFSSHSSSNQSSIQATGPVPTVIKYSSVPPRPPNVTTAMSKQDTGHYSGTPMVVKYSQENASGSPGPTHHVNSKLTQAKSPTLEARAINACHNNTSHQFHESGVEKELAKKDEVISKPVFQLNLPLNSDKKTMTDILKPSASEHHDFLTKEEKKVVKGTGLCQGALSSTLLNVGGSEKGQVKALSFTLSEREKATREMLTKRQESKAAVRRIVQPKIIPEVIKDNEQEQNGNLKGKPISAEPADVKPERHDGIVSATSVPSIQLPSKLENQMKNLKSTLDAIEIQCQESRIWQQQQQKELERSLKQRDERRLQNLEDMQKQLLECQLKHPHTMPTVAPAVLTTTSAVRNTTEGLSSTQAKLSTLDHVEVRHPRLHQAAGSNVTRELLQGAPTSKPQYTAAVQRETPSSFKTSVYNKPSDVKVHSGLKRKFVRNTRTQTSPRYSSSVSSSEMTSPLETPLPRKRPPVPMSRDWKSTRDSSRKHVHFNASDVKNPKELLKARDDEHDRGDIVDRGVITGGHNQTRNRYTCQDLGRWNTSERSEDSHYIVNDIGKLRQELKDALKETERTKLSLQNLHDNIHSQMSDNDVLTLPDHTQPYPLDAYLRATRDIPDESETPSEEENPRSSSEYPTKSAGKYLHSGHYADAASVLRDVQRQKENLESNLLSLTRQHEEQHLYRLVDDLSNEGTASEGLRIKKEIAKKIEEIGSVVQKELLDEERQKCATEKEKTVENTKGVKSGTRSAHGVPLSTEKRAKIRNIGKENQPRGKPAAKPKITKPVARQQSSMKRPLDDPSYVSRVYGRQDHVPRRTTVKPPHVYYQSPAAPNKSSTPVRDKPRHRQRWNDSVSSLSSDENHRIAKKTHFKPRYYFQPSLDTGQAAIKTHLKDIHAPLPGQLLSMAIPLGKPKTDPSLRLPVNIAEAPAACSHIQPEAISSTVKQPNVAVITIKDDECLDKDDQPKKHKKTTSAKEKIVLEKQFLPNIDIDTSSVSDVSEAPPVKAHRSEILPCPDPVSWPAPSEYEEFRNYEAVRDIEEEKDNEKNDSESVISVHGEKKAEKPSYQGPAFPPQTVAAYDHDGFKGVEKVTPSETIENKAMEWVEQELLARVVSEMRPPLSDPTNVVNRSRSSSSHSEASDQSAEPDLFATIGLRGIQLFVDAGIPVNNDLIHNLIMEVLKEKVSAVIGYPKPQNQPSPKEESLEDYTEPESTSEDYSRVGTPVQTPSLVSQAALGPPSHVSTPEQSDRMDSSSSSSLLLGDDMTKNVTAVVGTGHKEGEKDEEGIEEGPLDDSVHHSPLATPVATPSPRQSVIQLSTPEISEQDHPESEKTTVGTPEITVSVKDVTPDEGPQEPKEEDLKEQTLMEEPVEQDDKQTVNKVSDVKIESEPGQSDNKTNNSPSSITTTTYSTHSTMGTVATDDEISEGEQLQPLVHVGQYSEGEFAAPLGVALVTDNMATMQEIPDDILDSLNNTNKKHDVFKHAVSGLLGSDKEPEDGSGTTEDTSSGEPLRRVASETCPSRRSLSEDISRSEGEVAVNRDVVAALLAKIRRQPLNRRRRESNESASAGELVDNEDSVGAFSPGLPQLAREDDLSPGEFTSPKPAVNMQSSERTIDRPQGASVFDSDENNNESAQNSSLNDVQNQSWNTNEMVTPLKKTTSPVQSSSTTMTRVVQVTEARHESTPTRFFLGQRERATGVHDVTMETISDIEASPVDNDVVHEPKRIQLTLPFVEPVGSPDVSEGVLEFDETIGDASSISGGEIP